MCYRAIFFTQKTKKTAKYELPNKKDIAKVQPLTI